MVIALSLDSCVVLECSRNKSLLGFIELATSTRCASVQKVARVGRVGWAGGAELACVGCID